VRALGAIAAPECIAPLVQAADEALEPSQEVRTAATYALADVARRTFAPDHATELIKGLLSIQEDTIGDVRAAAIYALGFSTVPGDMRPAVTSALKTAVTDEFYWAREAAQKTMKALNIVVETQ